VLIAIGEIGVREADVAKLVYELVVRLHEVQPAGSNVANVQRDVVTDTEQILRLVTAPTPYAEETLRPAPRHVFDGHGYTLARASLSGPAAQRASGLRGGGGWTMTIEAPILPANFATHTRVSPGGSP